ncbi:protein of unknown function [Allopseudospirillum japonicum]|uniref:DUF4124 domain-containing protein n=1 Tax=Allopseudospirillum japonicum TaxID=64971 RepID=A0A1H6UED8_9GAMM|nr:DUF4124 domain-containing protein [Allopseudospirillum japonicum]SEI90758.1 protein of unknown function [Allopseudospirillum japonicum]
MKLMLKLMLMLLVLAMILPMALKGPDGRPLMRWQDWLAEDTPQASGSSASGHFSTSTPASSQAPAPAQKIYRWQDETGRWHFSDTPPLAGQAQEAPKAHLNLVTSQARSTSADQHEPMSSVPSAMDTQTPSLPDAALILHNAREVRDLTHERQQLTEDVSTYAR